MDAVSMDEGGVPEAEERIWRAKAADDGVQDEECEHRRVRGRSEPKRKPAEAKVSEKRKMVKRESR